MRRARPEDAIQKAVFEHIRVRGAPGVFAFHVPLGGYRRPAEARILKGLGVRAGVPDILAIHDGKVFALELKAPGGRPSEAQLEAISRIRDAGGFACIAEGLDRALSCLEAWGILKGTSDKADDYDAADDFGKSINACYEAVRARKAAGGKGWP